MAVLPPFKRLLMEDFKSQQAWISPLLLNLNGFMDQSVNALSNGLTIAANTTGDVKSLTLATVPTPAAPASIQWTKRTRPIAVLVGQTTYLSGAALTLTSAVQVQWAFITPSTLQITNIVGVTPTDALPVVLQLIVFCG